MSNPTSVPPRGLAMLVPSVVLSRWSFLPLSSRSHAVFPSSLTVGAAWGAYVILVSLWLVLEAEQRRLWADRVSNTWTGFFGDKWWEIRLLLTPRLTAVRRFTVGKSLQPVKQPVKEANRYLRKKSKFSWSFSSRVNSSVNRCINKGWGMFHS